MSKVAEILEYMSTWGDADAVASQLGSVGIQGDLNSASRCPVTQYFREVHGLDVTTVPTSSDVPEWSGFVREFFLDYTPSVKHEIPANVDEFVQMFDMGAYPQLVKSDGKSGY